MWSCRVYQQHLHLDRNHDTTATDTALEPPTVSLDNFSKSSMTMKPPMSPTTSSPSPKKPTVSSSAEDMIGSPDDTDNFSKTLSNIKAKNVRPDLLASIITHYASRWLPELTSEGPSAASASSPRSSTAAWLKKRFLVESLIGVLPPEKDSMPCDFLLRLLRAASMAGAGAAYMADVEARVAYRLDQASLKEVMIPAFNHTSGTLLDVGLLVRLVSMFLALDEAARSGAAAMAKVAKLVDSYLAEAALDAGLTVAEFERLATAMPSHSRATDDGLYRAVDTYIKAHPSTKKQEKKLLSRLIDPRKLSPDASLHAIHNDRLPVRSVIQILYSEQCKLNRIGEGSLGSFSGSRSPIPGLDSSGRILSLEASGRNPLLEASSRSLSKHEALVQQHEMRKLRDDVVRLQTQCRSLQAQIDRLSSERKKKGIFRWSLLFRSVDSIDKSVDDYEVGLERRTPRTPMDLKKARTVHGTPKWRNSLS